MKTFARSLFLGILISLTSFSFSLNAQSEDKEFPTDRYEDFVNKKESPDPVGSQVNLELTGESVQNQAPALTERKTDFTALEFLDLDPVFQKIMLENPQVYHIQKSVIIKTELSTMPLGHKEMIAAHPEFFEVR